MITALRGFSDRKVALIHELLRNLFYDKISELYANNYKLNPYQCTNTMAEADQEDLDEVNVEPVRELEDDDYEPVDGDEYLDWEVGADVDANEKSANIGLMSSGKGRVASIIAGFLGIAAFVIFTAVIIGAIVAAVLVLTGIGAAIASRIQQDSTDDASSDDE